MGWKVFGILEWGYRMNGKIIKGKKIAMIGAYPQTYSGSIATHIHKISKELSKYNTITVNDRCKKKYWNKGVILPCLNQ